MCILIEQEKELAHLLAQPTEALLQQAWAVRAAHFPATLQVAAPGAKHYDMGGFCNHAGSFLHVSVTGRACALQCEHCTGRLLESMAPATTPEALRALGLAARARGALGCLVSGGADREGRVPLLPFVGALRALREAGLRVIVHCGLVDRETATALKEAGVEQVLLDIIGDADTCREIYHLDKGPEDYRRALALLKETGLSTAPHVVVGLHRGQVRGEYRALADIAAVGVDRLVLVLLSPLPRTPLAETAPPAPEEAARVMAVARLLNPGTPLALGCARPAGPAKATLERLAIDAGVNAIAYPLAETISYAEARGLDVRFHELCCSLG